MKLFVYGSLMLGMEANHLLADSIYLDRATLPGYRMYSDGLYPGIYPEGEFSVHGELWIVHENMLPWLDRYEDVPRLYTRELVTVYDSDNIQHEASVYVLPAVTGHHAIDNGVWRP